MSGAYNALYAVPFIPLVVRSLISVALRRAMAVPLDEGEQDSDAHRTVILALAGFSFLGVVSLAAIDASLHKTLQVAVYYVLVSFLAYMAALNIQGYKHFRWQDQLGDALMESASLCLILSAVAVIRDTYADPFYAGWITFLAIMVWGVDFVVRLRLSTVYLYYVNKKEMGNMGEQEQEQDGDAHKTAEQSKPQPEQMTQKPGIKSLTYARCKEHGLPYPIGGKCPKCP